MGLTNFDNYMPAWNHRASCAHFAGTGGGRADQASDDLQANANVIEGHCELAIDWFRKHHW
jgi:hypothetical protein